VVDVSTLKVMSNVALGDVLSVLEVIFLVSELQENKIVKLARINKFLIFRIITRTNFLF
jgi:hypothetical protein